MQWQDEGIILGGRRHGESSLILDVMTRAHGRQAGFVKGGRSRRVAPLLQPGNLVAVTWHARLEEQLGSFAVETTRQLAPALMGAKASLYGLNLILSHLRRLAERDPHPSLFEAAAQLLDHLQDPTEAAVGVIRFELALLTETGFGLDLSSCAATGQSEDLIYVSPKSGRAVSREAGVPYRNRLLALPLFLVSPAIERPDRGAIEAGFALTGYFLERELVGPQGSEFETVRNAFIASVLAALDKQVTSSDATLQ
jgi:DNA repair protein RecO (recombination protein O)